jgi:hypothetical protein
VRCNGEAKARRAKKEGNRGWPEVGGGDVRKREEERRRLKV